MVRLPEVLSALSPLVPPCLLFSPHMCACVGWCVRLPEVLSPLVSPCLPTYVCLCWMACPPSRSLVSPCLPLSPPSRGLVSACLPLSPHMCACVGWSARLPEVSSPLVSHCLPTCVPMLDAVSAFLSPLVFHCLPTYVCLCWMVCLPSRNLVSPCLPLPPIVAHVCLCWKVWSPSRGLVSPLSPNASHCSHCLPTCVPVLDGVFAFPRCPCVGWCVRIPEPLSPGLSPIVSPHVCLCWMMSPPFRSLVSPCLPLPPHVFPCLAWSPFLLSFVGWFVRLPEVVSPLASLLVSLCWMVCPPFLSS